jgi:hypothetical protein
MLLDGTKKEATSLLEETRDYSKSSSLSPAKDREVATSA